MSPPLFRRACAPLWLSVVPAWLYSHWRVYELAAAISANACLVIATIDYERRYSPKRDEWNCRENEASEEWRWAMLGLTVLSVLCILLRDLGKKLSFTREGIQGAEWLNPMTLLQVLTLMVFPYPQMRGELRFSQRFRVIGEMVYLHAEVCYTAAEVAYVIMFLRLIFLMRVICRLSLYESNLSYRVGALLRVKPGFKFSIQCFYYQYSFTIISSLFTVQIFLLAVSLRIFERPFAEASGIGLDSYSNVLWVLAVTTTTIGYGDYYPTTRGGRLVCGLVAVLGSVLVVASITALLKNMDLTVPEMHCYRELYEKRRAGKLMRLALKYNISKRTHPAQSLVSFVLIQSYIKHHRTVEVQNYCWHEEEREEMSKRIAVLSIQLKALHSKVDNLIHNAYIVWLVEQLGVLVDEQLQEQFVGHEHQVRTAAGHRVETHPCVAEVYVYAGKVLGGHPR